jgi:hypothetical protein
LLISADTRGYGPDAATAADPVFANHLRIADFAASLSQRLLAETHTDGTGPDDDYLRGYARAMSDLSEALIAGEMCPGGPFCPDPRR